MKLSDDQFTEILMKHYRGVDDAEDADVVIHKYVKERNEDYAY